MDKDVQDELKKEGREDVKNESSDMEENISDIDELVQNEDLEKQKELEGDGADSERMLDEENENECEPAFKIRILENKIKEQEDAYLRINAEYSNFRRRTAEEKNSIGIFANEKIMAELIPVLDNMERALEAYEDKENQLYIGVEMVYKQLVDALEKSGLEVINAGIGDDFDHNFHMAVLQEKSSEYDSGKILMELQKGYKLGKKVLRASMVKVSS